MTIYKVTYKPWKNDCLLNERDTFVSVGDANEFLAGDRVRTDLHSERVEIQSVEFVCNLDAHNEAPF